MKKNIFRAKLINKKDIAKDTFEYTFKTEESFDFVPGQYIWVEISNMSHEDRRGNRRAFSISNSPNDEREIIIIFRSTASGFNQSLRSLDINDEVDIHGPFGMSFCLPEDKYKPVIMMAGGTGVSPFLSTIRSMIKKGEQREISLVCSNLSEDRALYKNELEEYNRSGYIKAKLLSRNIEWNDVKDLPRMADSLVYVSGPQIFVDNIHDILKRGGVFENQFRFENFFPTKQSKINEIFENGSLRVLQNESVESKNKLKLLYEVLNSSTHHTIVTDINGVIVFANAAAQKITGYSFEEMRWNTPRLWGGLMPKKLYEDLWKSKTEGIAIEAEFVNRRKNGDIYNVLAHISAIKDSDGNVIGYIGNEEDITNIKESERIAKENESRFIQLTEKIPEIYWIIELDPVERVVYINSAFEKIWGRSIKALYEKPRFWTESIHPEDRIRVVDEFNKFLSGERPIFDMEFRIIRPGKEVRDIHVRGDAIIDDGINVRRFVGVARDITIEKTVDREKTEFVSLASHQLKTPIGAINWNLEMLLSGDYGDITDKQKEVIREVYSMGKRMNELVNGLLNMSRIETGVFIIEPVPTDFKSLCDEVVNEMKPKIVQKGHSLIKEYDKVISLVPADPKLLRIVFQNFISNAIKYTKDKGKIRIILKATDNEISFSVANNGDPIPESDQPKIFSKMFRASNANSLDPDGNGLGLYIVKQIVENAGGRIGFTSKPGEDTVFFARFPSSGMIAREGTRRLT